MKNRALALGVLALVLLVVWAGLVRPLLGWGDGPIAAARQAIDEQSRLAARLPELRQEKEALTAAAPDRTAFLPGTDPALAAAALQGRLNGDIKVLGGTLASSESLALPDEQGFHRAGLRLKLSLPEEALTALLQRLEFSAPLLFIDQLSITAGKDSRLDLTMDLSGYLGGPEMSATAAVLPAGSFAALSARPLFSPSRHRSAAERTSLAAPGLRLAGLVTDGGRNVALISLDDGRTQAKAGIGASLNGWQLVHIDGGSVDLVAGAKRIHVALKQRIPPPPE